MFKKITFIFAAFFACLFITACSPSTEDIAAEVRAGIEKQFERPEVRIYNVKITNLTVTHIQGNQYKGILEVTENGRPQTYVVEIIHDGKTVQWEVKT